MSLLDINDVESQLDELNYLLYDNFVSYLSKHVPRRLWDHNIHKGNDVWIAVNYIKFIPQTRINKQVGPCDEHMIVGTPTYMGHLCIHITPTDDGFVNIELPKYIYRSFPILILPGERVPKTILKLLEPLGDNLEIIEGCL